MYSSLSQTLIAQSGFQMSVEKTKTKAITPTNHDRGKQRDGPITIPSYSKEVVFKR